MIQELTIWSTLVEEPIAAHLLSKPPGSIISRKVHYYVYRSLRSEELSPHIYILLLYYLARYYRLNYA
jgi:hypothetical protein